MAALGGAGDTNHVGAGYHKLLVVIFIVGLLQIIIAKTGLAKFAAVFPASVVEGMLAAIGVLIFVKAIPLTLGVLEPGHPHGFLDYLAHIPGWIKHCTPSATLIGATTLVVMLLAASEKARKYRLFQIVPPHLLGVLVAVPMGLFMAVGDFDPRLLIQVPANPLAGVSMPAFSELFADSSLWKAALVGIVTLLLIDGVESLATAQAIDRVDPFKRNSDPDRVLLAMGVSNMLSSLVGGLTVIPGGVKSKTNIEAGGRTLWSNFVNAMMLLAFLFVAPGLISLIPTAALGGILVYTGWKMAHPRIAKHLRLIGGEQLAMYVITIIVTLLTDLLIGVLVGTFCKFILLSWYAKQESQLTEGEISTWKILKDMFGDPVEEVLSADDTMTLRVKGSLVSFNAFHLREHLAQLKPEIQRVNIELTGQVAICDHTACETVLSAHRFSGGRNLEVEGLAEMTTIGPQPASIHLQKERRLRRTLR